MGLRLKHYLKLRGEPLWRKSSTQGCKRPRASANRRVWLAFHGDSNPGTAAKGLPFGSIRRVHQAPKAGTSTQTVASGVRALPWERFVAEL